MSLSAGIVDCKDDSKSFESLASACNASDSSRDAIFYEVE